MPFFAGLKLLTQSTQYRATRETLEIAWRDGCSSQTIQSFSGEFCGKDTPLLRHFYIKCIILPRQARDKHREN
eukprot:COSAG06_NODE_15357_length_1077_cov_1.150307_2_plen_72_part_01